MNKKTSYSTFLRLRAIVTVIFSLALVTFPARLNEAVNVQEPARKSPPPVRKSDGGPKEGIKVHGHWTIDVRNPDGTLVSHREFENALADGGEPLVYMLMRIMKAGEWQVILKGGVLGDNSPCVFNGTVSPCFIYETSTLQQVVEGPAQFKTLTIGTQGELPQIQAILRGTMTASRAGLIAEVFTNLRTCPVDRVGLCDTSGYTFTSTTITPAVNVANGQIVQITVALSFS